MKRGVKPNMARKMEILALLDKGLGYQDIAKVLGMKSRQAVRYHHLDLLRRQKENKLSAP